MDRKVLRKALAESTPDDTYEALIVLVDSASEMARELRVDLPTWLEACANAWAEAHDKALTHCDIVEDSGEYEAIVAVRTKWTAS